MPKADSDFIVKQVLLCCWVQALSPAMEQWRKRISKIAASFEANKAEISTAEKQTKSANKSLKPEVTCGWPPTLCLTGRMLQSGLTTAKKAMHVFSESACLTLAVLQVTRSILQGIFVCMMLCCRSVPDTRQHLSWVFQWTLCKLLSVVL